MGRGSRRFLTHHGVMAVLSIISDSKDVNDSGAEMLPEVPAAPELSPSAPAAAAPISGLGDQLAALVRYLAQTEVHTYAFSVAANAILSLFPFIVLMLTVARRVFHSHAMELVIGDEIRFFLPAGQEFVVRNMTHLVHAQRGVQVASVITLLVSSTGVFMPLEVALNRVWGVTRNRSYLANQVVSLSLALLIGTLTLASVALTASQHAVLTMLFLGNTHNAAFLLLAHYVLQISAAIMSVLLFFLIYWLLPNRKLPIRAVLPAAMATGLVWESAKLLYIGVLPWLDFQTVYGPFSISVSLMMWAFFSGLLVLAGGHFSATRHTLREARLAQAAHGS